MNLNSFSNMNIVNHLFMWNLSKAARWGHHSAGPVGAKSCFNSLFRLSSVHCSAQQWPFYFLVLHSVSSTMCVVSREKVARFFHLWAPKLSSLCAWKCMLCPQQLLQRITEIWGNTGRYRCNRIKWHDGSGLINITLLPSFIKYFKLCFMIVLM